LKAINLAITTARLKELLSLDQSIKVEKINDSTYAYRVTWGENNQQREAFAKADANNVLSIFDRNDQPIKVLGRVLGGIEKGITADYDLLVICPSYKTFEPGSKDKTPFPTQGLSNDAVKKNIDSVNKSEKPNYPVDGPQESAEGGNWSQRIEDAVRTINKNIRELDPLRNHPALDTTHHNAEFNNPFADDLKNNMPCLFVLPREMDLSSILNATQINPNSADINSAKQASIVLIETPEEMNLLRNVLRDQGYYWPAHARYNETIKPFRPEVMDLMEKAKEVTAERKARSNISSSTRFIFQSIQVNPNAPVISPPDNVRFLSTESAVRNIADANLKESKADENNYSPLKPR
jgi:hypothetical protein